MEASVLVRFSCTPALGDSCACFETIKLCTRVCFKPAFLSDRATAPSDLCKVSKHSGPSRSAPITLLFGVTEGRLGLHWVA